MDEKSKKLSSNLNKIASNEMIIFCNDLIVADDF